MHFTDISVKQLSYGDVIRVKRTFYYHYGIYIGNNSVINLTSFPKGIFHKNSIFVKIISTTDFMKKSTVIQKDERITNKKLKDLIVKTAYSKLDETRYLLLIYDCRSFVQVCQKEALENFNACV